jgi:hypothetical protein
MSTCYKSRHWNLLCLIWSHLLGCSFEQELICTWRRTFYKIGICRKSKLNHHSPPPKKGYFYWLHHNSAGKIILGKTSFFRHRYAGIMDSFPAWSKDVWLLWVCLLSGRGLCDGPITRPEKSYRMWCVQWVWSWRPLRGGHSPKSGRSSAGEGGVFYKLQRNWRHRFRFTFIRKRNTVRFIVLRKWNFLLQFSVDWWIMKLGQVQSEWTLCLKL